MYPEEMVNPMRAELTDAGFKNLYTADDVKNAIKAEGTTLVVINSVCGCAARNARPGAKMSLEGGKKPAIARRTHLFISKKEKQRHCDFSFVRH